MRTQYKNVSGWVTAVSFLILATLLPTVKAEPNFSAEMKFALETRDYVLKLINTNLENEGKTLVQCGTVEYHVDAILGNALDRFTTIQNARGWQALDALEVENGVLFILDTDPNNPRAFALAGIQDLPSGATITWFSRCLQKAR